jgi:hypothetical protein
MSRPLGLSMFIGLARSQLPAMLDPCLRGLRRLLGPWHRIKVGILETPTLSHAIIAERGLGLQAPWSADSSRPIRHFREATQWQRCNS